MVLWYIVYFCADNPKSRISLWGAAFTVLVQIEVNCEVRPMAGKIPNEVIDEIRSQTNIVDVVGQYVQLKKAGKNLFGVCPFHDEKTPSFSVSEEKQIFHCFSCGRGGNVFKFLMELEQISFPEALTKD